MCPGGNEKPSSDETGRVEGSAVFSDIYEPGKYSFYSDLLYKIAHSFMYPEEMPPDVQREADLSIGAFWGSFFRVADEKLKELGLSTLFELAATGHWPTYLEIKKKRGEMYGDISDAAFIEWWEKFGE